MRRCGLIAAGTYAAAGVLGLWFVWFVLPFEVVLGVGPAWQSPPDDLAQNLAGHLAFQQEGWGWPPLAARRLLWPDGISIALTDSNPMVSVVAKLVAGATGVPVNLFGAWFALCWVMQPVAAVYVVRGLGARSVAAAVATALVALSFPAMLDRMGGASLGHINLCGHFLVLAGLGWSIRKVAGGGARWWQAAVLATATIFIHPFLFILLCGLFVPPVVASLLAGRGVGGAVAGFAASTVIPYGLFAVLAGVTGGGEHGYGLYSMNLASPFWPQRSGLFGVDLPVLDATGGQYEGFNYLGGGALLLLMVAGTAALAGRVAIPPWRVWIGHALVLAGLTALAVSHKAYLGPWAVLSVEASIVERLLGPVRASGRLFWPVGYALALVPLTIVATLPRRAVASSVLGLAALLQWVDAAPLRAAVHAYFTAEPDHSGGVALPAAGRLLTTSTDCRPVGAATTHVGWLRLDAIRAGMALGEMRLSRPPAGMTCEAVTSDARELALRPGEVRAFVGARAMAAVRSEVLGPETACRQGRDMTLCMTQGPADWDRARIGPTVPELRPEAVMEADGLAPLLGWGWVRDREDRFWSNGPRAALLFRLPQVPAGEALRLRLHLAGIGAREGRANRVRALAGPNVWPFAGPTVAEAVLPDAQEVSLGLDIAAGAPGGIVRVLIEIPEPVDPRVRGTAMPVRWAGVRLHRLELAKGAPAKIE